MPDLTPERLREIEERVEHAIDGNISSVEIHIEDSEVLIAALRQVREERDGFAAATAEARRRLEFIGNMNRPLTVEPDLFVFSLQQNAVQALVNINDPAACLKARDRRVIQEFLASAGLRSKDEVIRANELPRVDSAGGKL